MGISLVATISEVANVQSTMSDYLKASILTAFVTSIISILGFIVTNITLSRNFKNELRKQKTSLHIEKMSTIPFKILELMDNMIKSNNDFNGLNEFKELLNVIYSYGSEKAIIIVSLMQKENYDMANGRNNGNKYRIMVLYVLLATQIKYDVTGIKISPDSWYKMKLTDYEANKDKFKECNNKLVSELNLIDSFKIK